MSKLTATTWIPLGATGVLVAGGIWIGAVQARVSQVEVTRSLDHAEFQEAMKEFREMNRQLGILIGKVDRLRR